MNVKIKIAFLIVLSGSCSLLFAQDYDSLSYLSRDFYRAYNIYEVQKDKESKYRLWNVYTQIFDSVYDIKSDEYVYTRIDSIAPIELSSEQLDSIHFWTIKDRQKLFQHFKIDSLNKARELNSDGWELQGNYTNYHKNFYIIEKKGNKYYKIKVVRRRRLAF